MSVKKPLIWAVCILLPNGANEESVRLFLGGKIKFTDIAYLNNEAMLNASDKKDFSLGDVLEADRAAREYVIEAVK